METYFVVLQLPGSRDLKFVEGRYSPENFWPYAANAINEGLSDIVSVRQDTGISEAVRSHALCSGCFETYLLFYLMLNKEEARDKNVIIQKISDLMKVANYEMVVDSCDSYQLVMRDYLDMGSTDANGHYFGGTHLSA
ncbi:hypothetical protein [uncultured Flavobacterium sp.]|uniref:hypothetical protein n=1 Tax=uncultured Flavobacterium sp. TaxID=165435 RepID=UPI0025FAD34A|nr:hypothetical protein [uncultured Flavobacterium sp.]